DRCDDRERIAPKEYELRIREHPEELRKDVVIAGCLVEEVRLVFSRRLRVELEGEAPERAPVIVLARGQTLRELTYRASGDRLRVLRGYPAFPVRVRERQ